MRAVVGRPATLRWHLTDDVGSVLVPDSDGVASVSVLAGDGSTVVLTSTPAVLNPNLGAWEATLPPQSKLDSLAAIWTATVGGYVYTETITTDVVAGRLVEPFQLQNDTDLAQLLAQGPELLVILVDQVEEIIRDILGFPPVLEGFRQTWDVTRGTLQDSLYVSGTVDGLPYGWGAGKMLIPGVKWPAQVYAGTINGVAQDPTADIAKISVEDGCLTWNDYRPWISGRYSFWGTHGAVTPSRELRQVALKLIHHVAQTTDYPDRAYSVSTEGATIMFSMPSPDRPTGLPEVDAVLARLRNDSVI